MTRESDRSRRRATAVEIDHAAGQLLVTWGDGAVSRFSLAELRRRCPCANCREARQQAAHSRQIRMLEGEAATATAEARGVERVGRYGVRITWADGHDYGIYTWAALRDREAGAGSADSGPPG